MRGAEWAAAVVAVCALPPALSGLCWIAVTVWQIQLLAAACHGEDSRALGHGYAEGVWPVEVDSDVHSSPVLPALRLAERRAATALQLTTAGVITAAAAAVVLPAAATLSAVAAWAVSVFAVASCTHTAPLRRLLVQRDWVAVAGAAARAVWSSWPAGSAVLPALLADAVVAPRPAKEQLLLSAPLATILLWTAGDRPEPLAALAVLVWQLRAATAYVRRGHHYVAIEATAPRHVKQAAGRRRRAVLDAAAAAAALVAASSTPSRFTAEVVAPQLGVGPDRWLAIRAAWLRGTLDAASSPRAQPSGRRRGWGQRPPRRRALCPGAEHAESGHESASDEAAPGGPSSAPILDLDDALRQGLQLQLALGQYRCGDHVDVRNVRLEAYRLLTGSQHGAALPLADVTAALSAAWETTGERSWTAYDPI
eukprot:TRINITY_DN8856_c0_g1_i1.p1 TRINITY_DN8856_c0_g1~~TRINITY_DN8856_c0_g1_i1.p1  ORF type:complete len:437 (+),score=124.54 TRINITY_DN8856_c0_g1_i1:41-1312(+)